MGKLARLQIQALTPYLLRVVLVVVVMFGSMPTNRRSITNTKPILRALIVTVIANLRR